MSMTTLLTLASMFGALSNVTPPISYHTKLDIWMVTCIIFVFCTLAEFTVVIFLKYYLNNLPPVNLQLFETADTSTSTSQASTLPSSARPVNETVTSISHAWTEGNKNEQVIFNVNGKTVSLSSSIENKTAALRMRRDSSRGRSSGARRKASTTSHLKTTSPTKPTKPLIEVIDDDASEDEDEDILEERRIMSEKIIKRIERYSVIVFFLCFLFFNVYYWYDIMHVNNIGFLQFEQNAYNFTK